MVIFRIIQEDSELSVTFIYFGVSGNPLLHYCCLGIHILSQNNGQLYLRLIIQFTDSVRNINEAHYGEPKAESHNVTINILE